VGPRTGLDQVKWRQILFLVELELRPLGCPARSQYRLTALSRLTYNNNNNNNNNSNNNNNNSVQFIFIYVPMQKLQG
jgi:hypothetical protein